MSDDLRRKTSPELLCSNERSDHGEIVPCERPAVGWRWDDEAESYYPVCVGHVRHPMQILVRAEAESIREAKATAWDEGYADSEREWEHVYGGHAIDPDGDGVTCTTCRNGNPYRTDEGRRNDQLLNQGEQND